jgi:hypothetical protein
MQRNGHCDSCDCPGCMALVQAAIAINPDGSPFFSDEKLQQLADASAAQDQTRIA